MQKLRWLGLESTRIRVEPNGEKVDVEVGEVIEVSDDQARFYTKADPDFVVVGSSEEAVAEQRLEKKKEYQKERIRAEKEAKKEQEKAEKEAAKGEKKNGKKDDTEKEAAPEEETPAEEEKTS